MQEMNQSNAGPFLQPNGQVVTLKGQPVSMVFAVPLPQQQAGQPAALGYTSQLQHQVELQATGVSIRRRYGMPHEKCGISLSFTMIILGSIAIVLNTVSLVMEMGLYYCGHGFWGGFFFILAGAFGLAAYWGKTKCNTVAFLVFSIFAAVITIGMLTCASMGIEELLYFQVVEILLLIVSLIGGVVAIVLSATGCYVICGGECCCEGAVVSNTVRPDDEAVSVIVSEDL